MDLHSIAQPLSALGLLHLAQHHQQTWAITMQRKDSMGEGRGKSSNYFRLGYFEIACPG